MQVTLFKALKSINIADDAATDVVAQVEEHIAMKINEATKGLEAQLKAQTWLIGTFGALIAIMGAVATFGPVIQKVLGH